MSITVTPFLWFDANAESAIQRYQQVFPETEIVEESRLPDGALFLAVFRLQRQTLTLLNGGPGHPQTDAFSLSVGVETHDEVLSISDALIEGVANKARAAGSRIRTGCPGRSCRNCSGG